VASIRRVKKGAKSPKASAEHADEIQRIMPALSPETR